MNALHRIGIAAACLLAAAAAPTSAEDKGAAPTLEPPRAPPATGADNPGSSLPSDRILWDQLDRRLRTPTPKQRVPEPKKLRPPEKLPVTEI